MATRWTSRVNPLSWVTRRGNRPNVVVPGGVKEYEAPPAFRVPRQDDFSAVIGDVYDEDLEWLATAPNDYAEDAHKDPTVTLNELRPRTHRVGYDEQQGILRVTFREGASYEYDGITPAQWQSLLDEKVSTGKWMARNGIGGPGSGRRIN